MRVALIAGASGLVGRHLLDRLLGDTTWDRVVSVGRRSVPVDHDRLLQQIVELGDLADLADGDDLGPVDDVFCALGTTMKAAGSKAAFRAVDHDAVLALAQASRTAGADRFLHVSAMGADASSRIFYNRVKGETERDVAASGLASTTAFRPSILDGDRQEHRLGEQVGLVAMRALAPALGRFRPTPADDVAAAMVAQALAAAPGHHVVAAREIRSLAAGARS